MDNLFDYQIQICFYYCEPNDQIEVLSVVVVFIRYSLNRFLRSLTMRTIKMFLSIVFAAALFVSTNAATANRHTIVSGDENAVVAVDVGLMTISINEATTQDSTDLKGAFATDIGLVNRFTRSTSSSINVTVNKGATLAPDVGSLTSNNYSTIATNITVTNGANMARDVGFLGISTASSIMANYTVATMAPDVGFSESINIR